MTLLWLALAALLLPALWWLVVPLRQAERLRGTQQEAEASEPGIDDNLAIYRRRLASLEAARDRGDVSAQGFEADRLELERELLEDTRRGHRSPLGSPGAGRLMAPLLMVAVVLASLLAYHRSGSEGDLALRTAQQEVLNGPEASVERLIEALEGQAARQPDNPSVWRLLYPLYRDSGRLEPAMASLQRLIELQGRRPALLARLAQLRYFAAGRRIDDATRALIDEVLAEAPTQPTIMSLLGFAAFQDEHYRRAIERWRTAIAGLDDERSARSLRQAIDTARQRLGDDTAE
ncbi:c-type cytochrome biogenesis protein CcmI [Halomonas sp. 18H]|uniref:c-type cytochrome biogenesis protein CcmI n=1 Tax=Halomonas almeriensis TaxID=308163 RepID=UPI0022307F5B|nr:MULTISPECIES: c-type cytochrome biogenesis protein CcmI [Halomonas]MCW4149663.1 c-type cytochrome biogenesis protein CcmI [Halomonas sp. 18H]MDN3553392.1 c-type cytochrome biogenesis protein CcmI [Halomonas almeriensis]